jgi:hypothetical protein
MKQLIQTLFVFLVLLLSSNSTGSEGETTKMYVLYDDFVCKTPNADPQYCQVTPDNCLAIKKGTEVTVIDKTPIIDKVHNTSFTRIKLNDGKFWYVYTPLLTKRNELSNHEDSSKLWQSLPLPKYQNLVGTTYSKKETLPKELAIGQFISVGRDHGYSLSSIGNIYNKDFGYIFFEKLNNPGTDKISYTILDIIAYDLSKFKKNATVWFQQCECKNKADDCSDIIAIYYHDGKMATKNIMVKPDKAWRPNYTIGKLEAIPPESVKCGSLAPEEDDNGGP